MKKRIPAPTPNWDLLYPLLIAMWRKLMKLPLGPEDRLQTREFRTLVDAITSLDPPYDLEDRAVLGAYLMYKWPLHYAEGLSLIKELPIKPNRVLELGAKGAPYSLAALEFGAREVFAVDTHELALKHGAEICGHLGYPFSVRTADPTKLRQLPVEGKWDLIILGHSLFERYAAPEAQLSYIQKLQSMLSEQGYLLIVEDSANEVNRRFLQLRDLIAQSGIAIQAPCLWKGACPALRHSTSPCYAQRPLEKPFMIKEIQRAANINLSSLKMSYLILKSPLMTDKPLPDNLYRVVSPALKTFRGDRYFLCGVQGKKTLGTSLKEHPKQSKAFEYIKKGDVLAIDNALEIEDDLQVGKETSVLLAATFDRPVPS